MTKATRAIVLAALAADPSVSEKARTAALAALDGGAEAPGRVIATREVRKIFCGVTSKTLRSWAKRGRLVPVFGSSGCRIGYTERSVRELAAGRAAGGEGA